MSRVRTLAARPIAVSTFAIAANGTADGPAQALRDYLVMRGAAQVTTIFHPLVSEDRAHEIATYEAGGLPIVRRYRLPSRPPFTYPLDLVVPPLAPRVDAWFGFNCLACVRGLWERRLGRVARVAYWCVDFVPDRFGNVPMTRVYDYLDALCCRRAHARVELSAVARDGRDQRHGFAPGETRAPTVIVPMGAWLARVPTTPADGVARRRVVYMGHLVPRQGVDRLIEALGILARAGSTFSADIIGRGPEESALRQAARSQGLADRVTFHGFVADHREVERLLAAASVAAAPYVVDATSFTRFADPGKLKAYLAAGLPIVMTSVPPNAAELSEEGGAEVVADSPPALAAALERALSDGENWKRRRAAALAKAREFDWPTLLDVPLRALGFAS